MTNPNSKQGMIFECMNANADKPMEEVVQLILQLKGVPGKELNEPDVRSTYLWAIRTGKARGVGKTADSRPRKTAAAEPKAPKNSKPKLIAVPKPKAPADKPKVTEKTVEEIADIRAKNLARLKAVGAKHAKGQYAEGKAGGFSKKKKAEAKQYVEDVTNDLDAFKAPEFLSMDDVKALV